MDKLAKNRRLSNQKLGPRIGRDNGWFGNISQKFPMSLPGFATPHQ
jgi:hypothetical protein